MVELTKIESTNINGWHYDSASRVFTVEFKDGSRYEYAGVPADVADGFAHALDGDNPRERDKTKRKTYGKYFHAHIRNGGFEFTQVGWPPRKEEE